MENDLLENIRPIVDERMNWNLIIKFIEEEVRCTVFSIGAFKALRPDHGCPLSFFLGVIESHEI